MCGLLSLQFDNTCIAYLRYTTILLAVFLLHREKQGLATPGLRQPRRGTTMYTPRPPNPRNQETWPYWRVTLSLKVNPHPKKGDKFMQCQYNSLCQSIENWQNVFIVRNKYHKQHLFKRSLHINFVGHVIKSHEVIYFSLIKYKRCCVNVQLTQKNVNAHFKFSW